MKVRAYFEIAHGGKAIYSLDVHPSGRKLVTGGHGSDNAIGEVKVWNLTALYDSNYEIYPFAAAYFNYGVNCVRWAASGKEIVVADDGGTITVLQQTSRTRSESGRISEVYRPVHTVQGHKFEVLHVELSPSGALLASTSIDSTARIWSMKRWPRCVAVLDEARGGHKEAVKGCSWDPTGRLLATQSSDRSAKVWKTDSWQCVFTLDECFSGTSQTMVFNRMDWSPDGSVLILPCAVNNGAPTAQIVLRRDWTHEKDFAGHRRPIGCVAFSKELRLLTDSHGKKHFGYVVALGGRDQSLSVWSMPRMRRPIVVIEEIVQHSILDMRWLGRNLFLCSLDGSTRVIMFKESELGIPVSETELNAHVSRLYGCSLPARHLAAAPEDASSHDLENDADRWNRRLAEAFCVATPHQKAEERRKAAEAAAKRAEAEAEARQRAEEEARRQAELRAQQHQTKTGKKRIVTQFLGALETVSEAKIPRLSGSGDPKTTEPSTLTDLTDQADAEGSDEAEKRLFLRTVKFTYEMTKPSRLELNLERPPEILYDDFDRNQVPKVKPYLGLVCQTSTGEKRWITITNERQSGFGQKIARFWDVDGKGLNAAVDGHVLAAAYNRRYIVVVLECGQVKTINRQTADVKDLVKLSDRLQSLAVFGNFCVFRLIGNRFDVLSLLSPKPSIVSTGSLTCFPPSWTTRLLVVNGTVLVQTKSSVLFTPTTSESGVQRWRKIATPSPPMWPTLGIVPPSLPPLAGLLFSRIAAAMLHPQDLAGDELEKPAFHIPLVVIRRCLDIPSERRLWTFVAAVRTLVEAHLSSSPSAALAFNRLACSQASVVGNMNSGSIDDLDTVFGLVSVLKILN